jgi:hypothetical protein|tara:strand:+ start:2209 stop:2544 length:336 start_codon:yes stop_codon:yes gene_type:complete
MATNIPRQVPFKGDHPYFKDGERYTCSQYANWTQDNCEDGGVTPSTIKSRLYELHYCKNDHLLSPKKFKIRENKVVKKVSWRESRKKLLTQPRLTADEAYNQTWLSRKIVF